MTQSSWALDWDAEGFNGVSSNPGWTCFLSVHSRWLRRTSGCMNLQHLLLIRLLREVAMVEWRSSSFGGDVKPSVPMVRQTHLTWFSEHYSEREACKRGVHPLPILAHSMGSLWNISLRLHGCFPWCMPKNGKQTKQTNNFIWICYEFPCIQNYHYLEIQFPLKKY